MPNSYTTLDVVSVNGSVGDVDDPLICSYCRSHGHNGVGANTYSFYNCCSGTLGCYSVGGANVGSFDDCYEVLAVGGNFGHGDAASE